MLDGRDSNCYCIVKVLGVTPNDQENTEALQKAIHLQENSIHTQYPCFRVMTHTFLVRKRKITTVHNQQRFIKSCGWHNFQA